ncbi:hypothetical protein ACOME3_005896 [Neoechinorhynchus agilis]
MKSKNASVKTALLVIDMQNDFIVGSMALKDEAGNKIGHRIIPTINKLVNSKFYDIIMYTLDWHPKEHLSFYSNRIKRPFRRVSDWSNDCELYDDVIYDGVKGSPGGESVRMTLWPDHCIAGSEGAEIHAQIKIKQKGVMLYKGTRVDTDGYSAFTGHTDRGKSLAQFLISAFDSVFFNGHYKKRELIIFKLGCSNDDFFLKILQLAIGSIKCRTKENDIDRIDLCGIALDYCVVYTALDGKKENFVVRIIKDACQAIRPEKTVALYSDIRNRGISVVDSSSVLNDDN